MSKRKSINILVIVVLSIGAVVMLVPFIWMLLTAFKSVTEATQVNPFVIFPSKWLLDGFESAIAKMDIPQLYWNTIWMIVGRVVFAVLTATMAGYAFARLEFKGKKLLFTLVIFQMMIPTQIFIIPQYLMINALGAQNTIFALIFPGLVTAFGTFLMRQNFINLPKELEESARLDGCNVGQTFLFIMLPLAKSGMVALGIFTALFAFKDLMWSLVVNTNQATMPLASALAKLQGTFSSDYPELMAASLLACIPMIVIYLIFQKQFVEGIATSGGKL